MQTKAVIRAAIEVQKEHADWTVKPEIMIPLVCEVKELKYVKNIVVETADAEIAAAGVNLEYEVGTMIEIPRAALTADEIATEADFCPEGERSEGKQGAGQARSQGRGDGAETRQARQEREATARSGSPD